MKRILLTFFAVFFIGFSEVKDNINIFSETEKKTLEEQIKILQEKYKIKVFVVTSEYGEGYVLENPERTLIINVQKSSDKLVKVEESFTNDMNMQEKDKEISLLIDNLEPFLLKKEYVKYIEEFANGALEMYSATEKENIATEKKEFYIEHKWGIIKWTAIILTLLNIIGRIWYISKKKKQRLIEATEIERKRQLEKVERNKLFHEMKK